MKVLRSPRSFEWDDGNRGKNFRSHKVTDEECEEAFADPFKKIYVDPLHSNEENRFVLLGATSHGRFLFLVFTLRRRRIRVISARDLKQKEYALYKEKR